MRVKDLDCVKRKGWRHALAHHLGTQKISDCLEGLGQWVNEALNKESNKKG